MPVLTDYQETLMEYGADVMSGITQLEADPDLMEGMTQIVQGSTTYDIVIRRRSSLAVTTAQGTIFNKVGLRRRPGDPVADLRSELVSLYWMIRMKDPARELMTVERRLAEILGVHDDPQTIRHVDEMAQLRQELWRQWEFNHSEHCDLTWPHSDGDHCSWPVPDLLRAKGLIYDDIR